MSIKLQCLLTSSLLFTTLLFKYCIVVVAADSQVKRKQLSFSHITDIHLDLSYAAHIGKTDCQSPPCCRKTTEFLADPILSTMKNIEGMNLDKLTDEAKGIGAPEEEIGEDMYDEDDEEEELDEDDEDEEEEEEEEEDDDYDLEEEDEYMNDRVTSIPVSSKKRVYAGKFGEYNCDTPIPLLQSALEAQNLFNPDFMVWSGDTGPHRKPGTGPIERDVLIETINTATEIIYNVTRPDTMVVPCLGNYDFSPTGSYASPEHAQWLLDAVANAWSRWLPDESVSMLRTRGYYQMPIVDGFRAIVLNTQECDILNFYTLVRSGTDSLGDNQLDWLRSSLKEAESVGDNALIVGHIPPGIWNGCYGNFTERYQEILAEFPRTVSGQVFGHRHSGSFRLLKDSEGEPSSVALITPSLTPYKDQNPSFRMYHLSEPESDPRQEWPESKPDLAITSVGQYAIDLEEYNESTDFLTWHLSFWLPGMLPYNRTSLSPAQYQRAADLIRADGETASRYQYSEANKKKYMANDKEAPSWACSLTNVKTHDLISCAMLAEEVLIKHYVNSDHNYVLTNLYPFEQIYYHFCTIFYNLTGDPYCDEKFNRYSFIQ